MDKLNLNLPESVRDYQPRNYQNARHLANYSDASAPLPNFQPNPTTAKNSPNEQPAD